MTIVIGSGLHCFALNKDKSILCNWKNLLQSIFPENKILFNNYILEFERFLVDHTSSQNEKAAYEKQAEHLILLKKKIEEEQSKIILSKKNKFPTFLFDPNVVSDVISLNFDLIPELLLNREKKLKTICGKNNKKNSNSARHHSVNGIRFWHPHGDIYKQSSLILGLRQYAQHLKEVEKMRVDFKANGKKNTDPTTWYEAILKNPIMIVGASLSEFEWDIWTALVNRERNFARKKKSKINYHGTYMMNHNCNNNKHFWIDSIFDTKYCYEKQWEMLEQMYLDDKRVSYQKA